MTSSKTTQIEKAGDLPARVQLDEAEVEGTEAENG